MARLLMRHATSETKKRDERQLSVNAGQSPVQHLSIVIESSKYKYDFSSLNKLFRIESILRFFQYYLAFLLQFCISANTFSKTESSISI